MHFYSAKKWLQIKFKNLGFMSFETYCDNPKSLRALKAVLNAISSGFFCIKAAINSTNAGKQHGSFR